jgi:hypothetical protein
MRNRGAFLAIGGIACGLAGCNTTESLAPLATPVSATASHQTLPSDGLIGRWGVASYREEKDRARTLAQARSQCRNAYVIAKGPTDGVIMHVADDPKPYELALKKGGDGKTYLGFASPPGDLQDREVVQMTQREMTMKFVDPDANARYGTFVYVRC